MTTATERSSGLALDPASLPWLDRALYPFQPRRFETPHGTMRYLDEGSGSPVVLVHGTPSWSFEWRAQVAALARTRRVIAPDHLGFGLSDKPHDPGVLRPVDHAERLTSLFDALDLRDVTLVVHDFGGPIGLPLALDRGDRVRSVVVMNTWMWAHGDDPKIGRMSRFLRTWLGRWLYLSLNASPRWIVPISFGDRTKLTPQVHAHYLSPFATREDRTSTWTLGVELAGSDPYYASLWEKRARLAEKPLTIAWGTADPAFDGRYLTRWREAFPSARVEEVAGAGHFPQEESPARVTEIIERACG